MIKETHLCMSVIYSIHEWLAEAFFSAPTLTAQFYSELMLSDKCSGGKHSFIVVTKCKKPFSGKEVEGCDVGWSNDGAGRSDGGREENGLGPGRGCY